MNETFIFNSIRKYNRARRQTQKDCILAAVGIHTGLIKKGKGVMPTLSLEERQRVLYFLRHFLAQQNLEVLLND